MKHLKKYNENKEIITNIEQSELFNEFYNSVIDYIESNGGDSKYVGFCWVNINNGTGTWRDFNTNFITNIKKKTKEEFEAAASSEEGIVVQNRGGMMAQRDTEALRMCFVANLGKIKLKGNMDVVLDKLEKLLDFRAPLYSLSRAGFDKVEFKPFYEPAYDMTLLYAQLTADETIKIGNTLEVRLPKIPGFRPR